MIEDLRFYDVIHDIPGEKSASQHVIEIRIYDGEFQLLMESLNEHVNPIMSGEAIAKLSQSILSATEAWTP